MAFAFGDFLTDLKERYLLLPSRRRLVLVDGRRRRCIVPPSSCSSFFFKSLLPNLVRDVGRGEHRLLRRLW